MEKINNNYALFNPDLKRNKNKTEKKEKSKSVLANKTDKSFSKLLENNESINELSALKKSFNEDQIEKLLQEIGIQGKILKRKPVLEELNKYKSLIKEFVTSILNQAEGIEKKTLWNRARKEKVTKVHLKIINNELLELTEIFLKSQKNIFEIASKIDKIEGILIDMKS